MGRKNYGNPFQCTDDSKMFVTIDGYYVPYNVTDIDNSFIDCGTNEELFLALAALRDDSYRYQFITDGDEFIQISNIGSLALPFIEDGFHKATPAELIEYFKR